VTNFDSFFERVYRFEINKGKDIGGIFL